jgi:hypothetical protein
LLNPRPNDGVDLEVLRGLSSLRQATKVQAADGQPRVVTFVVSRIRPVRQARPGG